MIYLWHLFIKWSLVYPTSALICDIPLGLVFVVYMALVLHDARKKRHGSERDQKETELGE